MGKHNKNTSSLLNFMKIAGALLLAIATFSAVFTGIFDFKYAVLELIAGFALSIYGVGELIYYFVSGKKRANKKPSAFRVFLTVFFSLLLIYAIALLLFMRGSIKEEGDVTPESTVNNVYVESAQTSQFDNNVYVEDIPQKDSDKMPLSPEESLIEDVEVSPVSTPEEAEPVIETPQETPPTPTTESADVLRAVDIVAVPYVPLFIGEPLYALINSPRVPDIPTFTSLERVLSGPLFPIPRTIKGAFVSQNAPIEGEWASEDLSDDDFWADFYIAGEEELILEDGIYYFDLYVNGKEYGTTAVLFASGISSIYAADIKSAVDGYITEEAEARIFRGEEYLSVDTLLERGVYASINADEYKVTTIFSPDDMPIERISISGGRSTRASRIIAGAELLEPAVFTLISRYSLSTSFAILPTSSFEKSINSTLSVSNTFRLYDVNGSFSLSLKYYNKDLSLSMSAPSFYVTIPEKMMRISWGNVAPDLLSASGTPFGIRFDKSLSYAPDGFKRPSHIEKTIAIEKDSDVKIINEGKEIYRKTLTAGKYSLNDFILYSGANRIKIVITPLDGSPEVEHEITINYSSALLAPGEFYYGAAFATGMVRTANRTTKAETAFRLPWLNNYSYDIDARNIALSFYFKAGLSKTLTMNSTFALSNTLSDVSWFMPKLKSSFELTHANKFGAARYNINIGTSRYSESAFTLPSLYFKVGQQFSTGIKAISGISLSSSYSISEQRTFEKWGTVNLSAGFSGVLGLISWGLNGSVSTPLENVDATTWSLSSSISTTLSRHFSLSASGSIYSSTSNSVGYNGRVSANITFSPVRSTVSYSTGRSFSASASTAKGKNSYNMQFDASDITNKDTYTASTDYSRTGNYIGFNGRLNTTAGFKSLNGSVTLTSSSVFADGLFTFSQSIPSGFVLIKQKGVLKGNEVTVGALGTTNPEKLPMVLGTGLYRGVPTNGNTSFSIFSAAKSSLGAVSSFDYTLPYSTRGGYAIVLRAESSYSVAGFVKAENGELWINGSSPIYKVDEADHKLTLTPSDDYIFTDSEGLFILSGVKAGLWAFDAEIDGDWYLFVINVKEDEKHVLDMNLYSDSHKTSAYSVDGPYKAIYEFNDGEYMTGDEFWNRIYLSEEVL